MRRYIGGGWAESGLCLLEDACSTDRSDGRRFIKKKKRNTTERRSGFFLILLPLNLESHANSLWGHGFRLKLNAMDVFYPLIRKTTT